MTTTKFNDLQLIQMHREWWKDSYGTVPNSQASVIAAAFARHVLEQVRKYPELDQ